MNLNTKFFVTCRKKWYESHYSVQMYVGNRSHTTSQQAQEMGAGLVMNY